MIKDVSNLPTLDGNVRSHVLSVIRGVFLLSFPVLTVLGASCLNTHMTWVGECETVNHEQKAMEILLENSGNKLEISYILTNGVSDLLRWHLEHWPCVASLLIVGWLVAAFRWCYRPSIFPAFVFCAISFVISMREFLRIFI